MKKIVVLFSLLVFTFSYGQKKVKKSQNKPVVEKKAPITEEELAKKITTSTTKYDDAELVIEGRSGLPTMGQVVEDENAVYNMAGIEVQPEFPGGRNAMNEYILSKYVFPELGTDKDPVKGKVFFSFIVEKDGSITDIKIIRDIGNDSGKQIINILKMMPKWTSGKQNGKNVRCLYHYHISVSGKS
jgi:protein TonB